jgi:predicted ABC-type ATPase
MSCCYIIAGPNGAGKSTFAIQFLPDMVRCDNFINADMIAAGISPLNPENAQIAASRIFLKELRKNIHNKVDFAFETTLSGSSYLKMIKNLKANGWHIILFYLWIPSVEFSSARVKQRVEQGGHNIPEDAISRRYSKSIKNLMNRYVGLCDEVYCLDNSGVIPQLVFELDKNGLRVNNKTIYDKINEVADDK